jgi:hypothetical protein
MICPSCRQDVAPIVRGVRAYCTACGAPMPFTAAPEAVNLAGQPAKVGGGIAKALGWLTLGGGLLLAMFIALIAWALPFAGFLFYVAGFFAVVAALVAVPLLLAAKRLEQKGESRALAARERAVFALAAQQRGVLTVKAVARALEMQEEDADALLTGMAKRGDGVSLEVDDNGGITYVFRDLVASGGAGSKVRIDGGGWRVPQAARVDAEPRVVDAELIEEEEAARGEAPGRRVTR